MKKLGIIIGSVTFICASSVFAEDSASFPLPCVVVKEVWHTDRRASSRFDTYDSTDRSYCGAYGTSVENAVPAYRPMMLSLAASGAIVKVKLDNHCYSDKAAADAVIKQFQAAGACK